MPFDYSLIDTDLQDLFHNMEDQIQSQNLQFNGIDETSFVAASVFAARTSLNDGHTIQAAPSGPLELMYDGKVIYNNALNTYIISSTLTTDSLNTLINTANDNSIIQFQQGTYNLTELLHVTRGDITIQGMGDDNTTFNATLTTPDAPAAFQTAQGHALMLFEGGFNGSTTLAASVHAGDIAIQVADVSKLAAGQEIQISQYNDQAFLDTPLPAGFADNHYLSANVTQQYVADGTEYGLIADSYNTPHYPMRVTLTEITAIEGNTVYLKNPIGYDMDADKAAIAIIKPLDDLHVSGFTLTNDLPATDPDSLTNTAPDWKLADAIKFYFTRGSDVNDITILNTPSEGLTARSTYDSHFDNITIIGAANKDAGGNGYGLNLAGAQYNTFENITIIDTRHGVLFSSWATEVGNIVHVLETNRDVNFHGSPDHDNIVIVDKDILDFAGFSIIGVFGASQPFTDIDANTAEFSYAIGGAKIDVMHGTNFGSYLDGGAGYDYLYGGAGKDVLIGGVGNDQLTGGAGADIFVMSNEGGTNGGTDTVMDFNPTEDKLFFYDVNKTINPAWVKFIDKGADTAVSVTGYNGNFLLKGVTVSQLTSASVILNQKPYSTTPADWADNSPSPVDTTPLFPQQPVGLTINGTDNSDMLVGGDTYDILTGGLGDDIIIGGLGLDTSVYAGSHDQYAVYTDGIDGIFVIGAEGFDRLYGVEMLRFSDGDFAASNLLKGRWLEGTENDDVLIGKSRDDILIGKAGNDSLFGDLGKDVAVYSGAKADYSIYGDGIGNLIVIGLDGFDRLSGIETLRFSDGDFDSYGLQQGLYLIGTPDANIMTGFEGNDIINGYLGDDIIIGNSGTDIAVFGDIKANSAIYNDGTGGLIVIGSDGFDRLSGVETLRFTDGDVDAATATQNSYLEGTNGAETLNGSSGDDILVGKGGFDVLNGGDGVDTAVFAGSFSEYKVTQNGGAGYLVRNIASGETSQLTGIETLKFNDATDSVAFFAPKYFAATSLNGENFTTGPGDDTVTGLLANFAGDTYALGAGTDKLTITDKFLDFGPVNMPYLTGVDIIDISASQRIGNITINNAMVDQSDKDTLVLKNGNSLVRNLSANITDPNMHLVLEGTGGIIRLSSTLANTVYVSDSNTSEIIGGTNKDIFYGGKGADIFTGGNGADTFILQSNTDISVADTIRDFSVSQKDVLNISKLLPAYTSTAQSIDNFVALVQSNGKTLVQIDETGSGANFHTIAILEIPITQDLHSLISSGNIVLPSLIAPPTPPDSPMTFVATAALNTFIASGTASDMVTGLLANMHDDVYSLGAGIDTLKITTGVLDFTSKDIPSLSGIDIIDVSAATRIGNIQITDSMIAQSDSNTLLLKNGAQQIRGLSANITDSSHHLVLEGTGVIRLASTGINTVYASDNNKSEIIGGTSKDIFYGGSSQDIFTGGSGADVFHLKTNTDGKYDIIRDFSVSQKDVLDVSQLIESYDPLQHSITNFLQMSHDTTTGKSILQVDETGSGANFHTAVMFDTEVGTDIQNLISKGNLIP